MRVKAESHVVAGAVVETVNYLLLIFAVLWNRHARPVESGSVLLQYLDSQ